MQTYIVKIVSPDVTDSVAVNILRNETLSHVITKALARLGLNGTDDDITLSMNETLTLKVRRTN